MTDNTSGLLYFLSFLWSIVLSVILVVYYIVCHSCGLLYCLSFLWPIVFSVILVVDHKNDRKYNRPQEWQTMQYTTRMTDNTIDHKNDRQYNRPQEWQTVQSCGLLYFLSFLWSIVLSVILVVYCTVCHSCGLLYCLSFLWSIVLSVILVVSQEWQTI
jgi:Flp pilus assembly protein TadB